ncbi:MAG: tRNA pseudouridine(38-40) synthase TruA [Deltaproteobacteria bacterium]|jgi:tRNA pseudouridine38-40 synthase|nr:tRNA pseudouridine(38-40) synthase TruA [Deltaproteobacteria bacterium]
MSLENNRRLETDSPANESPKTGGKNIKLIIAYDGTGFNGWQRQAGGRTIQGVMEDALSIFCGHSVSLCASGRTDAGVHARAQVANFRLNADRTAKQIVAGGNALLPPAISILSAEEAGDDFNARFSAKGKRYCYDFSVSNLRNPFLFNRAWQVGPNLDWAAMESALTHLVGEKDFAAFQSAGTDMKTSVRRIFEAAFSCPAVDLRRLSLTGSGFLRHMVRTIAGTLWLVGRKKLAPADLGAIVDSRNRNPAGPTAPPQGLDLDRVFYEPPPWTDVHSDLPVL